MSDGWDGIGWDEWSSYVVGSLRAPSVLINTNMRQGLGGWVGPTDIHTSWEKVHLVTT